MAAIAFSGIALIGILIGLGIVAVFLVPSLLRHGDKVAAVSGGVLVGVVAIGLLLSLFLFNVSPDRSGVVHEYSGDPARESATVLSGRLRLTDKESFSGARPPKPPTPPKAPAASQPDPPSTSSSENVSPSNDVPLEIDSTEEPDWVRNDAYADRRISVGPYPTTAECLSRARPQVAARVELFAEDDGLTILATRYDSLSPELIDLVIEHADEHFEPSPHTFGDEEQTWYTLHLRLNFDTSILEELARLHRRAIVTIRLVLLGLATAAVLAILAIAYGVLLFFQSRAAKQQVGGGGSRVGVGVVACVAVLALGALAVLA